MNPIKDKIIQQVNRLPKELSSIQEHALRYVDHCCSVEYEEILKIGHRPWVAPLNYTITIYPPIKKAWLDRFKNNFGSPIPKPYQNFLLSINGCFVYDFTIYGLPPSMQTDPPALDRSRLQCLDLLTANQNWVNEYKLDGKKFHIGARAYSPNENIGYFIDGKVFQAIRKNGEIVGQWDSLDSLLTCELKVSESMMLAKTPDDWWC